MAVNSGDFVQAAGLLNNLVEQANGDLEHLDMSLYISVGKNYDCESGGGAVTLQSKSITKTPTRQQQQQTVYPDPGFDGLSSVGVTVEAIPSEYVIPSGSVTITQNGTVDVSGKAQAIVNVPTGGGEPSLQQKSVTVTPTTQQQQQTVTPDSGFDGLSSVGVTVNAIPSEYVIPSGSVTITENGTVDVSGKAQAIVNVPTGGGLDYQQILNDFIGGYTNSTPLVLTGLRRISGRNKCTNVKFPSMNFPDVTSGLPDFCFQDAQVPILVFPSISGSVGTNAFRTTGSYLTTLDLGPNVTGTGGYSFNGCSGLNTLILRRNGVVSLANTGNTVPGPFKETGSGGTLYVPQSQIEDYQNATNWSTILAYANNTILPIEGSIYENAYADGTSIT